MKKRNYILMAAVILGLFMLSGCKGGPVEYKPIQGVHGFIDLIVWPMAGLMYVIGKSIAFANYGIVIILTTIVVRTLAWPIYAKTNDMTLKMQLMGPEQAKIEQKYAGKDDPESKQRKQMEVMQLYKKYGVGVGGCLIQIVQLPIFIAFYQTLQRVPKTLGSEYTFNFDFLNSTIFGIDLFASRDKSEYQLWGIITLALLVGITQVISQILISKRQKKAKAETQASVPEYRQPPKTEMQRQTEMSMKIMLYGMTVMMMVFVYNSTAALGLYWLVGNIYSTLQGYVGHKMSQKRMEKLKKRF